MKNTNGKEMICPECQSWDIESLGFDYDSARIIYECVDCGFEGVEEDFDEEE